LVPEWQDKQNGMDWPRAGKGSLPRLENVSRQKDCEPIGGQSARHEFHQELASGVSIVAKAGKCEPAKGLRAHWRPVRAA